MPSGRPIGNRRPEFQLSQWGTRRRKGLCLAIRWVTNPAKMQAANTHMSSCQSPKATNGAAAAANFASPAPITPAAFSTKPTISTTTRWDHCYRYCGKPKANSPSTANPKTKAMTATFGIFISRMSFHAQNTEIGNAAGKSHMAAVGLRSIMV